MAPPPEVSFVDFQYGQGHVVAIEQPEPSYEPDTLTEDVLNIAFLEALADSDAASVVSTLTAPDDDYVATDWDTIEEASTQLETSLLYDE